MEKGLVLVYTGDGKGKTTAALGLCMRAIGWEQKACIIQFLKSPEFKCGEKLFCQKNKIELHSTGIGYSWTRSVEEQKEALKKAWKLAKQKLSSKQYQLVILDEINNVLCENRFNWSDIINEESLISVLNARPFEMNVVLTGRNAKEKIIDYADLVTEMKAIKHPFEKGIQARKAIEY